MEKIRAIDANAMIREIREKEVWVMENPNHRFVYCSGCGMNVETAGYIGEEFVDVFRYCPNCGCRMDGIVMEV